MKIERGMMYYSDLLKGDRLNHGWAARVDVTDGYVGISLEDDGQWTDRVLVTPAQWDQIVAFVSAHTVKRSKRHAA